MSAFCAECGISRNTFYKLRRRAVDEGEAAVLEPRSRRPASSPTRIGDERVAQALRVRAALASSGLDAGPVSVCDKMASMGLDAPSPSSLARIFRQARVARADPAKRPRASWRRFVYPAPNACWQMDATGYVLAGGRPVVVFQVIDDHSRLAVASLVAQGETSQAAIEAFDRGVARHGVPQRLLTDNGAAMNPTRRGRKGALVEHVRALGVEAITGKPHHPTTQGKNERFHQTLMRYPRTQPLARSLTELQAQVDAFDHIYNTQRPHQGLPGRMTPQQAWDATAKADPPRPRPAPTNTPPPVGGAPAPTTPRPRPRRKALPPTGSAERVIAANGTVRLGGITFLIRRARAGHTTTATWDHRHVLFVDADGAVLAQYAWPPPGTHYVSPHAPGPTRQHDQPHPKTTQAPPMP